MSQALSSGARGMWVSYNNLTARPHWESLVYKGKHPQMARKFRLVNYCNFHIYMYMYTYVYVYTVCYDIFL